MTVSPGTSTDAGCQEIDTETTPRGPVERYCGMPTDHAGDHDWLS